MGSIPIGYTFYLFFYFTWSAKRLSRRAGLSATAEFLVYILILTVIYVRYNVLDMKLQDENPVDLCKRGALSLCWLPAIAAGEKDAYFLTSRDLLFTCKCVLSVAL